MKRFEDCLFQIQVLGNDECPIHHEEQRNTRGTKTRKKFVQIRKIILVFNYCPIIKPTQMIEDNQKYCNRLDQIVAKNPIVSYLHKNVQFGLAEKIRIYLNVSTQVFTS